MQTTTIRRRTFGLIALCLILLITGIYFHHTSYDPTKDNDWKFFEKASKKPDQPPPNSKPDYDKENICANANIELLTSSKENWNGLSTKAIVLEKDGTYTSQDQLIKEGDYRCVAVLLVPMPATSTISPEDHVGLADSIILNAVGYNITIPIYLKQDPKHANVYIASVRFTHADIYTLDGITEYRSYFWEEPTHHSYQPESFKSDNVIKVLSQEVQPILPACDMRKPENIEGSWMNKAAFQHTYPLDFYGMFGPLQEDHANDGYLYVPDKCRMEYIGVGQAAACFQDKIVHVWGDGNLRRNLKSFSNANRWCNDLIEPENPCICDDDDEDPTHTLYPWAVDPSVPLKINSTWYSNADFYFNNVDSIVSNDWKTVLEAQVGKTPKADLVILGLGNGDIPLSSVTPIQFEKTFSELLSYVLEKIYPHQTIILRTPQFFCCANIHTTSWNLGRSNEFALAVRNAAQRHGNRVLLWDVHKLGTTDNTCRSVGKPYSKRGVVTLENLLLWNLVCGA
ncbi:hypothetical protein J3Q64DRAFT_1766968 [Phycomyces blakesleeanus]|uniref:Uncharacterized protein n=2 Tax=Phycomyces blakesleeanus TaxID=4837 RepID=A0A162XIL8_PHYB8|nr:hypothetical protein PHYBLDRAFT_167446 [Phycomyces blakesleeanus NRRL 1555(-)]OAD75125.1 hypothetical protein PHYBLDRAFT_167446 [Phycomyces blakesleeanus NRRL 1555(-)]|eukprot:XP_018293165.1 hypothetical protein PHYBLDRAFT_167446 [Phycomyces blakesleeanus NRRL 1555(-)]